MDKMICNYDGVELEILWLKLRMFFGQEVFRMKIWVGVLGVLAIVACSACGPDMKVIQENTNRAQAAASKAESDATAAEQSASAAEGAAKKATDDATAAEDASRRANDAVSRLEAAFATSVTK
jgi:hypothetical protein